MEFKILPNILNLFLEYQLTNEVDIAKQFALLDTIEITPENFKFYTSISVMASSKIEGETLDIDSYVRHKMFDANYLPNLLEKPNDLYRAYEFAQKNKLTFSNFLNAHKILTEHLLPVNERGTIRKNEMIILEHSTNRIEYQAASASIVENELKLFWEDLEMLMNSELELDEIFYYASLIHLVFELIHPFTDGNGRVGRLLEKWFLVSKLGERSWCIASEKYYYQNVNQYYKSYRFIGNYYNDMDYTKSLPFLLMLPKCLQTNE